MPLIESIIAILLYSLLLLGLQRIHHVLVEIRDLLSDGLDNQDSGNKQRHLGLTYLYAMAKRQTGTAPPPPPVGEPQKE